MKNGERDDIPARRSHLVIRFETCSETFAETNDSARVRPKRSYFLSFISVLAFFIFLSAFFAPRFADLLRQCAFTDLPDFVL